MDSIESLAPVQRTLRFSWKRYLLDSLLATVAVTGITLLIFVGQLYPRIPNISILYLLIVLPLASMRGRYSATLASILAFLAFDFFLVPPYYTFVMYHIEEWIALSIFLIAALLTGHLAAALHLRAEEAARREHQTRALYHLMRATNSAKDPEGQLKAISQAIVDVLAFWGVQDCQIFLPDAPGTAMQLQTTASQHLLPLKLGARTVGVLCLDVPGDQRALRREEQLQEAHNVSTGPSSFFWTFLDQVTTLLERARLQQENMRLAIVQRTDTLRAALLSSVSHDLRTPLTGIKAAASALLQEEVEWTEEAQRSFLQSIEREADRLNRLVANLLDMSRIEDGALKPDKDWYSLKALIQDVLGRLASLLEGRVVQLHLPDDLLLVELDYLQIDQVLTNLLENALRYTSAGVPIEIRAWQENDQVFVHVADRGPGIPAVHLMHVFDKFYRVLHGPSMVKAPIGSGLGLAVCRGLVEAHGGKIWAEQREGGGLIVAMVLPIGAREGILI